MKAKLFSLIFITLLISCEKQEIIFDYPITLISEEIQVLSEIKVYTMNGEIVNTDVINEFIKYDTRDYFFVNSDTIVKIKQHDTITYQDKDTVIFYEHGLQNPLNSQIKRTPKKEGDYILFNLIDTLIVTGSEDYSESILHQIGIFKPYIDCYTVPFYYGGGSHCKYLNTKVAQGNPNKLEFPNLVIMLRTFQTRSFSFYMQRDFNNIFDKNVINLLEYGDTLAIQEIKTIYAKID